MRLLYIFVTYLLTPLVLASLLWRGFRNRGYWQGLGERFGRYPRGSDRERRGCIWVHAVSVGEVQAAIPLVRALMRRYPDRLILISTVTPTGRARARAMFADRVTLAYAPYDLPGAVRRFFNHYRPDLAIIMETELWPNLFHECGRREVPLVLASARISPRSVSRYRHFLPLFRDALAHGIVIAAQSERDAERFLSLGASEARTHTIGNIKFDLEARGSGEGPRALLLGAGESRPVWIAASTHQGEEQAALSAQASVLQDFPHALLVLVPRHPERFDQVAQQVARSGLRFVRRSAEVRCDAAVQVFLLDTLGELPDFFRAVDVAFVGGSLVPVGGHNLLEPAAASVPVITGPHYFNAPDIAEELLENHAAVVVADAAGLADEVRRFLGSQDLRRATGARALAVIDANRGTLKRLMDLITPLLDQQPSVASGVSPSSSG